MKSHKLNPTQRKAKDQGVRDTWNNVNTNPYKKGTVSHEYWQKGRNYANARIRHAGFFEM